MVLKTVVPKLRLSTAPHSAFAALFRRSQSGKKLPFASFHVRVVRVASAICGLRAFAIVVASATPYRPSEALTAVFPLPNRS